MDNRIRNALEQLVAAVLASDVYHEYDVQRNRVNRDPELKAQIDAYRLKNFELQHREDTALEQIECFEREYAAFRDNPVVSDFLAAELAFCRLMQEITDHLTEEMHFE